MLRAAESVGYRPDPEIAKTMRRLRTGLSRTYKSTLFGLTTRPERYLFEYHKDILRGVQKRAEELGYGFTLKYVDPRNFHKGRLETTLLHQNVEGVVLLPMAGPCHCDEWLPWERFSVVATTYGVLSPPFHRVVPHQFANLRRACAELTALGYRRIGLVIREEHSVVVNHSFVAALATQSALGLSEPVAPLLYRDDLRKHFGVWCERERPDSLILEGEDTYHAIKTLPRFHARLGLALANRERVSKLAGIDEQGESVGRNAVEILAFKLQIGEKGIPPRPQVTMIEGSWIPGSLTAAHLRD